MKPCILSAVFQYSSTITMQFARNVFPDKLPKRKDIRRKLDSNSLVVGASRVRPTPRCGFPFP